MTDGDRPKAALRRRDRLLHDLTVSLKLSRCPFDFGDERTIERVGALEGEFFRVGEMKYNTVVLPWMAEIQATTLKLIKDYAALGGRVIVLGEAPTMLDGAETGRDLTEDIANVVRVADKDELIPLLRPRHWWFSCDQGDLDILLTRRVSGKDAYWFLVNTDCSEAKHCMLSVVK